MHFDFTNVEDVQSFITIPPGAYVCRIAEVREGEARDRSVRWSFRLEVADGEYAGRTAAWDSITWSDRGIHRVRRVLESLGFDVTGAIDVAAIDLIGLKARAVFEPEEREDPLTGRRLLRLRVPYAGYDSVDGVVASVDIDAAGTATDTTGDLETGDKPVAVDEEELT